MDRIDYDKASDALKNINLKDFPLVEYYIGYDDCYMNDDWVRYTIFYNDLDIPVAVIAKRLPVQEVEHILIVEVNNTMRHLGFGKELLLEYMKTNPYWELFSVENAEGFYKKLGFKKDKSSELFYYGYELS